MQTIILPLLLILSIAYSANIPRCPENEKFTRCASPCQESCQNNVTLACPRVCIKGCVCREGFIREGEGGQCVHSCADVPVCKENEKFVTCGSACPRTCGDEGVRPCPLLCIKGCVCHDTYVRERDGGRCVPEEQCDNKELW